MSSPTDRTTCTDEMLLAAFRTAAELELIPRWPDPDDSERAWLKSRAVVEAALAADSRYRREPNPVPPGERWIEVRP